MKKIIFFDIDGTLIHHQGGIKQIPDTVIHQMNRLKRAGYLLFIASGRPYSFINDSITSYPFDGYILSNGAHVEYKNELLFHKPMEFKETKKLIKKLKSLQCEYIIETKFESYLDSSYSEFHEFFINCGINESLLIPTFNEELVIAEALKIEVNAKEDVREELESYIKGKFNYDSHGTKNAFEIYASEVTKAVGVKKVLKHFSIDSQNSYAFGDGQNDLEMLQEVGTGIAMGNAAAEIKAVANKVCGHVDEEGLAKALEKIF